MRISKLKKQPYFYHTRVIFSQIKSIYLELSRRELSNGTHIIQYNTQFVFFEFFEVRVKICSKKN